MDDARQPPEPGCFDSIFGGGEQAPPRTPKTKQKSKASRYEHKSTKAEPSSIVKEQPESSMSHTDEPNEEIGAPSANSATRQSVQNPVGESETPDGQTITHEHP